MSELSGKRDMPQEVFRTMRTFSDFLAVSKRKLSAEQLAAVESDVATVVSAGAGSGKTTVLIHRVDNLLTFGRGSDCREVPDWVGEEELRRIVAKGLKQFTENTITDESRLRQELELPNQGMSMGGM